MTGRGRKNLWGAQINFISIFGSEDQKKKKKKVFNLAVELLLGHTSRSRGARRNLLVRISFFSTNSGMKKKKKVFGSVFAFTRVFLPWRKFYSRFRGYRQYFGGAQTPKCTPVAPEHNPRLGGTLLAWEGTSSDLGSWPRNAPRGAGPDWLHCFENLFIVIVIELQLLELE